VGTEISKSFADYAKSKFKANVFVGDIAEIKLPPASFDVICLSSVIQYVTDPLGTLRAANLLLKKDGILYIEATNEGAFVFKVGDFLKSAMERQKITSRLSPLFPSFQIYGYTKKTLLEALRKSGFEILYLKVKGLTGGGKPSGGKKLTRIIWKAMILTGGITGNGHLLYCIARKRGRK